jgi:hypothetical protein
MTGYFWEMKPDASFALRFSVANMRAAGRVEENARDGVRKLFESYVMGQQLLRIYVEDNLVKSDNCPQSN